MNQERQRILFAGKYEKKKLLGEGSYGRAYLAECIEDKSLVVIKSIPLGNGSDQSDAFQECKILQNLEHQNIIRFRDVIKENKQEKKCKLYLIMDYADGGDLSQKIKAQKGKFFSENQILDWFTQICLAIKHIHDRKILHRDIKSQNIFLMKTGEVKLGDFGIAKCLKKTIEKCNTMIGTPYYLSPEIINGHPYGFKSDIWSMGVLLYEMCALKMPFDARNMIQLSIKITNCNYTPLSTIYSKDLRELVYSMLNVDIDRRPEIYKVLQHRLIKTRIRNFLSEGDFNKEFSHTIIHKFNVLKSNSLKDDNVNIINDSNENNRIPSKIHQRPMIISSNNNKVKNYPYRQREEKEKEVIQSSKEKDYISKIKKDLQGNMFPNTPQYKGHIQSKQNNNIDSHSHHRQRPEKDNYPSNDSREKNKNSNKNVIRTENSERNIARKKGSYEKDKENLSNQSENDKNGSEMIEKKKIGGIKSIRNDLKEFKKKQKEQLRKNPQEDNVIWMRGMEDYVTQEKIEKEKDNIKEQIDMGEENTNINDDLSNWDDIHIMNVNCDSQNEQNERTIDNQIEEDIDNEIGKEFANDFIGVVKKYINDDILYFDYEEIVNKIKMEYEDKLVDASVVEKAIEKIPDLYYLMLKKRL